MPIRILCIGNRYYRPDSGGPQVYDILYGIKLPPTVELIDGGLNGLNLLRWLEDVDSVIFVDSVDGFLPGGGVVIVEDPVFDLECSESHGPNFGLGYLLRAAPFALDSAMPRMYLVGIEGRPDSRLCKQAAEKCLQLADTLIAKPVKAR